MYKKSPGQWQELYLEKSYDVSSDAASFAWMQQLIRQYQLIPTIESDVERLSTFSTVPTTKESEGLWTAIEEWSPRWEQEYGRWVAKNLTPHFMIVSMPIVHQEVLEMRIGAHPAEIGDS